MKKNFSKSLSGTTLLLILALSGCGGSDPTPGNLAAYQQGSNKCSEEFIRDYVELYYTFTAISPTSSSDLDSAQSALNQFSAKYKDVSCKLEYQDQSEMVNVNDITSRLNRALSQAREQMSPNSANSSTSYPYPAPSSLPTTAPYPTGSNGYTSGDQGIKNGITLVIHDPSAFNDSNQSTSSSMVIQNGRLISYADLDYQGDYCSITYSSQATRVQAGSILKLIPSYVTSTDATYISENATFVLDCKKRFGATEVLTLKDINTILGNLATAAISL